MTLEAMLCMHRTWVWVAGQSCSCYRTKVGVCVGASTQLITIVRWGLGALESDRCSLSLGSLTRSVTLGT